MELCSSLRKVPVLGVLSTKFATYYTCHEWFQRFTKYGTWITAEYWLVKGPLTLFFTEALGFWYVLSAFIAGTVCTVVGFGLSELWIWKGKKRREK